MNPIENFKDLTKAYSSYADYLGLKKTPWVNPCPVLDYFDSPVELEFKKINNYRDFVEKYKPNTKDNKTTENFLEDLILEK